MADLELPLSRGHLGGSTDWVLLAMGPEDERDRVWIASGAVRRVVRWTHAAPSGRRRGSRALGLGIDAACLAVKAILTAPSGPYLAANPWTAVALRLLGRRRIAVTGLYAVPGTSSFRTLLRLLRSAPLVVSSAAEAEQWNAAGGRALAVQYGNTFGYPRRRPTEDERIRIFVGGSSDRDRTVIAALEEEVRASSTAVQLTVVDGSPTTQWRAHRAAIIHTGYVDQQAFGELVADSDVVVLPLADSGRAAGHMVLVGALEAGVPVLTTCTQGVREYVDGTWVRSLYPDSALLPQVVGMAKEMESSASAIRDHWFTHFSLDAYVRRVTVALAQLTGSSSAG